MLLSVVLAIKQFVMNLMKLRGPRKAMPPKFDAHQARMQQHYRDNPAIYSGNIEKKEEHF